MSDEVDDLLRRSMAALDGEVPPAYFDTLPERTLARLAAEPAVVPMRSRAPRRVAIAGLGLAAAAALTIFVTRGGSTGAMDSAAAPALQPMRVDNDYRAVAPRGASLAAEGHASAGDLKPHGGQGAGSAAGSGAATPTPTPDATVDELVRDGARLGKIGVGPAGRVGAELPAEVVRTAMSAVAGPVRACYEGAEGQAVVRATVAASGQVKAA